MDTKSKERGLFILGVAICFALAGLSVLLENLIPGGLLGASIIALFSGTIINSFFHPVWIKPALKFTSKKNPQSCHYSFRCILICKYDYVRR